MTAVRPSRSACPSSEDAVALITPPRDPAAPAILEGLAAALVCLLGACLIFALPFAIPVPFQPTVSASFVAGFNNHAAVLATCALSAAVFLWSWRFPSAPTLQHISPPAEDDRPLSARLVLAVLLATCGIYALAGWLISQSHLRYLGDAGYFIEQASAHVNSGRALYTQLEFAYGPLLFYPTVWLHALLHPTWHLAYFATLLLQSVLGLLLLAWTLNRLPLRRSHRTFGFLLLALGALTPLFGLNYTFFRFITPFAALLFATRPASLLATTSLLTLAELLLLAISPELGLSFLVGVACFALLRALPRSPAVAPSGSLRSPRWWLLAVVVPALVGLLTLATAGRSYLRLLSSFSHGALNLPVAPYPHLLVFLFAVIWLVPRTLGSQFHRLDPHLDRTLPVYALALALLPAALGRCDPLHVFFNGAGFLILSLACIRASPARPRRAWLAALLLLVLWEQGVNAGLYAERTADTLRLTLMPHLPPRLSSPLLTTLARLNRNLANHLRPGSTTPEYRIDLPALEQLVGPATPVATPVEVSLAVEAALRQGHHYRSGFYAFFVDVLNAPAEQRKIAEFDHFRWALLPLELDDPLLETPRNIDGVQGFSFPYPLRHPVPYDLGQPFEDTVDDHWTDVRHFGPYVLYRNDKGL